MKIIKIPNEIKEQYAGYEHNGSRFEPVWSEEYNSFIVGDSVLTDENFAELHEVLNNLETEDVPEPQMEVWKPNTVVVTPEE